MLLHFLELGLDGLIWSSLLFLRITLLNVITAVSINTYVNPEGRIVYSIPVQYQLLGKRQNASRTRDTKQICILFVFSFIFVPKEAVNFWRTDGSCFISASSRSIGLICCQGPVLICRGVNKLWRNVLIRVVLRPGQLLRLDCAYRLECSTRKETQ